MLPKIIETFETDALSFAALSNGVVFTAVRLSLIDLETANLKSAENALANFLKSLSQKVIARFCFGSAIGKEIDSDHSRSQAVSKLLFVENRLTLVIEIKTHTVIDLIRAVKSKFTGDACSSLCLKVEELAKCFDLSHLTNSGFKVSKIEAENLSSCLIKTDTKDPSSNSFGVELGRNIIGVIRLNKQAPHAIQLSTLAFIKDQLPLPFEIRTSIKKLSNEKSEIHLRRRTAQVSQMTDQIGAQKYLDSQEQLEDVALNGGSLFQFEFILLLPRLSEKDLRKDASETLQRLKPIGDFAIETFGAGQNYLSSQVGFDQHVTLLETDHCLPSFLPCFTNGSSPEFTAAPKKRSLIIHRKDQSLFDFDLYHPSYDNFSVNVIGRSGRGKSVFTNLLTRAIHHDPDISIIKIDVGGSHTKETSALGGVERKLLLSEPSGINPFKYLSREFPHSEDVCNVVTNFLNVLLLEEGETTLTKSMRGEIEKAVSSYSLSRPINASVSDFFEFATTLPRRDLLARWTKSGIYRNAFAEIVSEGLDSENRLKYFNFSQIFQANDPDFGQGGLAAVMAQFNLDLMQSKKKLVFIADETPFFIERCFSFFKFSTANVRKFGGSFITIAQKSSDLVIGGDTGIIENSAQKFIFSSDGTPDSFAARMKLVQADMEKIDSLQSIKGKFSEVLFQDNLGSRVLRLSLTPDEYWSFTSSSDDNARISSLIANIPGLTINQAITTLMQMDAR